MNKKSIFFDAKNLLFLIMVFVLFSCDEKRVFDEYQSVNNAWEKSKKINFELPALDVNKPFNLFVNLRDNNSYPYNNIFLIVSMEQPNRKILVDTLEYQMANPDGTLMGQGFSDIKESKLVYKENFKFSQKGKYKVSIQQAVRQIGKTEGIVKLPGITEVGFRIESAN